MQSYSPFDKPLNQLLPKDLAALKNVSEGWHVEYKKEPTKSPSIAKSISAFANTYGGWLFFGIKEESKENPVAGEFAGIPVNEIDSTIQKIRSSAAAHTNPSPHFETSVLQGPMGDVGLKQGRAIICIWVPMSSQAPHIHKNGHIYRRVSDSSEPKPENDRFILEQLFARGDKVRNKHQDWVSQEPELSKDEHYPPYIRVMLCCDLWDQYNINYGDYESLRKTLKTSSIPFDTVYTSAHGLIGRQLTNNHIHHLTLTWSIQNDLASDIIIPLPTYQTSNNESLTILGNKFRHFSEFSEFLSKYNPQQTNIVDLNYIFNILSCIASTQEEICKLACWNNAYHMKVKILNAWRTIPFIDTQEVLEEFYKNGPPMCLKSTAIFPQGSGPEDYIEIGRYTDIEKPSQRIFLQTIKLFEPIAWSFGLPPWGDLQDAEKAMNFYRSLFEAGERAINVQSELQKS